MKKMERTFTKTYWTAAIIAVAINTLFLQNNVFEAISIGLIFAISYLTYIWVNTRKNKIQKILGLFEWLAATIIILYMKSIKIKINVRVNLSYIEFSILLILLVFIILTISSLIYIWLEKAECQMIAISLVFSVIILSICIILRKESSSTLELKDIIINLIAYISLLLMANRQLEKEY